MLAQGMLEIMFLFYENLSPNYSIYVCLFLKVPQNHYSLDINLPKDEIQIEYITVVDEQIGKHYYFCKYNRF